MNRSVICIDHYEIRNDGTILVREIEFKNAFDRQEIFKVFKEIGTYKLIETEAELDEYIKSNLSCDDWCIKKLYETMIELGFGITFIEGFSHFIGINLDRFHFMVNLSKEIKDKELLMYMLVKKFGDKK